MGLLRNLVIESLPNNKYRLKYGKNTKIVDGYLLRRYMGLDEKTLKGNITTIRASDESMKFGGINIELFEEEDGTNAIIEVGMRT